MRIVAAFPGRRSAARAAARLRHRWPVELHGRIPTGTAGGRPTLTRRVHRWAAAGALIGAAIALSVQWWSASEAYPLLIGGRRAPNPASYLPVTIAIAMFWSSLGAVAAFLVTARLPRLHNALFDSPLFDDVDEGTFLLVIECGTDGEAAEAAAAARSRGATATDRVGT